MKTYFLFKTCGLTALLTALLLLLGNSEAQAQGMRGGHGNRGGFGRFTSPRPRPPKPSHQGSDAGAILNGVANIIGAAVSSGQGHHPGGHHPGGHHPGGYHPGGYRPGRYHPGPQYSTRPQVVYVDTSESPSATDTWESSSVVSNPSPPAQFTVVNPKENGVTLSFTLDGVRYLLEPGYKLEVRRVCVIEFDKGGAAGKARYRVSDGKYTFTARNGEWDLLHSKVDTSEAEEQSGLAANPVPVN